MTVSPPQPRRRPPRLISQARARREARRRGPGAAPTFLLIGSAKAGTTSLAHYLGLHPEIQVPTPHQLNYFCDEADFDPAPHMSDPVELGLMGPYDRNWGNGPDWYRSHFDPEFEVRGECSVSYTAPWYPGTAERIVRLAPEAKLIFAVREPIARMVSHHDYLRVKGFERRPIDDALGRSPNPYESRSRYAAILEPYLRLFGRERIHFLRQDELLGDRAGTLARVFGFLGVDPGFSSEGFDRLANRAADKGRRYAALEWVREGPAGGLVHALGPEAWWRLERAASRRPGQAPAAPSSEVAARARSRLEPDLRELERISGLQLSDWYAD